MLDLLVKSSSATPGAGVRLRISTHLAGVACSPDSAAAPSSPSPGYRRCCSREGRSSSPSPATVQKTVSEKQKQTKKKDTSRVAHRTWARGRRERPRLRPREAYRRARTLKPRRPRLHFMEAACEGVPHGSGELLKHFSAQTCPTAGYKASCLFWGPFKDFFFFYFGF